VNFRNTMPGQWVHGEILGRAFSLLGLRRVYTVLIELEKRLSGMPAAGFYSKRCIPQALHQIQSRKIRDY
jgi:hypothetical protein